MYRPTLELLEHRLAPAAGIGDAWPVHTNLPASIGDAWSVHTSPPAGIGDPWTVHINPADATPDKLAPDTPAQPAPRDVPIQIDDEIVPDVILPTVTALPIASPAAAAKATADLRGTVLLPTGATAGPVLPAFSAVIPLTPGNVNVPAAPTAPAYAPRTDLFGYGGGRASPEAWTVQSSPAPVRQTSGEAAEPMPERGAKDRMLDPVIVFDTVFEEINARADTPCRPSEATRDVVASAPAEVPAVETVPAARTPLRASRTDALPLLMAMMGGWTVIVLRSQVRTFVARELARVRQTGRQLRRAAMQVVTGLERVASRAPPHLHRL